MGSTEPADASLVRRRNIARFLAAFWWNYAGLAAAGPLLIVYYLTDASVDLTQLFKLPFLLMFAVMCVFHTIYRVKLYAVSILFGAWGGVAMVTGLMRGTLVSTQGATHLYMTIVPILAVSFGHYHAKYFDQHAWIIMKRVIDVIWMISVVVLTAYFYFHYVSGRIAYFGFDTLLPLVAAMLLARRQFVKFVAAWLLVLFSGKRAPLVSMLVPVGAMVARSATRLRFKSMIGAVAVVALLAGGVSAAYRSGMLQRFDSLFDLQLDDPDQVYVATSGRSAEIAGLRSHLSSSLERWMIGSGFGGAFTIDSTFRGERTVRTTHYLHLAVLTNLLVFGLPFFVSLLAIIARVFWRNRRLTRNFYYLAMVITFVGATFGASLIIEPVFWFFLGVNLYILHHPQSEIAALGAGPRTV